MQTRPKFQDQDQEHGTRDQDHDQELKTLIETKADDSSIFK